MNASDPRTKSKSPSKLTKKGVSQGLKRVTINPNIPITDIQIYCNPNVRVGNWSEDWISKQAHFNGFLEKQKTGQLQCIQLDTRVQIACEDAPLSRTLGYQVPLLFQHIFTLSLLSCDISGLPLNLLTSGTKDMTASFPVSLSENPLKPMRRNVLQCIKYKNWDLSASAGDSTEPLYFGDQFYLVMTHLLPEGSKPLYLQSTPKSTFSYSPIGKQGNVSLSTILSSACRWQLIPDDPQFLLERQGTLVLPGHRVCLQHCLSGHCLYANPKMMQRNDFGHEYEVMTKPYPTNAKEQQLFHLFIWTDQPERMMIVDNLKTWQESNGKAIQSQDQ